MQVEEPELSYQQAAQIVHGIVQKGTPAQNAIDSLNISDYVRARLIEKFSDEKLQEQKMKASDINSTA